MKGKIVISKDRVELAERVAITVASHIIENPEAVVSVAVGVCGTQQTLW